MLFLRLGLGDPGQTLLRLSSSMLSLDGNLVVDFELQSDPS